MFGAYLVRGVRLAENRMPRYFLDIEYDHELHRDVDGGDYADADAALQEAEKGLRDLLGDAIKQSLSDAPSRILVRDAAGNVVGSISSRDVGPSKIWSR